MNNHQRANQTTGNCEWYTPEEIIEAARLTMGGIDLDPASCDVANKRVKATVVYTKEDNGLERYWSGRVWLNFPSGRYPSNQAWVKKLVESYLKGEVVEACCLSFSSMSEKWMQPLMPYPQCFPPRRTNYINPKGKRIMGVTKGSVITYLGENVDRFAFYFRHIGNIKIAYRR
jgi:hypothetical protein